jgi:hypothetical protein
VAHPRRPHERSAGRRDDAARLTARSRAAAQDAADARR